MDKGDRSDLRKIKWVDFSEVETGRKLGLAGETKPGWSWIRAHAGHSAPWGKGVAGVPSLCLKSHREEACGTARLLVD